MNAEEAYRRIKFQAHPRTELGRVGGPLVDEIDQLRGELDRLRCAEVERPREMLANELRRANETVRRLQEENDSLRARLAEDPS